MAVYDLNLRDYWRIITKRKVIIIFTFLAMTTFSFISSTLTKPAPIYKTSATIKFEPAQTFYQQGYGNPQFTMSNLETQAAVIKSYFIMELVAKKLSLIPEGETSESIRNNSRYINIIMDLRGKVDTEQDGISNLIEVAVTSNDPLFAKNLANTVVQVYKGQHSQEINRKAIEEKKFIEGQRTVLLDKLHNAEEAVKNFRERHQRLVADPNAASLMGQQDRLVDLYEQKKALSNQANLNLSVLNSAENTPVGSDKVFYYEGMSAGYKALADQLVQLLLQRDMLLLSYTDKFPRVVEIKSQIGEIVRSMRTQLVSEIGNLRKDMAALQIKINEYGGLIQQAPGIGLELVRLERDRAIALEVYTLIEKRYQDALIAEVEKLEEVKIVKPALEQRIPINPTKIGTNVSLGMIIGLILGIVFAFLIETFDTSIGAVEEIEEFLGTRVLGIIPFLKFEDIHDSMTGLASGMSDTMDEKTIRRHFQLISHYMPTSTLAENYRALRTNFNFMMGEKEAKTVVITSTYQGEGKTSVAINMAIATAQLGHKVLLIDGDFRRPVVAKAFGVDSKPGFTDVILGNYKWQAVVRSMSDMMMGEMGIDGVTQTPGLENLFLMTSGTRVDNPAELIGAKGVVEIMAQMREAYDIVIVDAPPVLAATDATVWSSRTDVAMLVYQVGQVARGALRRAKAQLDHVRAQMLGIVLNGMRAELSPDFTNRDKYNYYYGYSETNKHKGRWGQLISLLPAGLVEKLTGLAKHFQKQEPIADELHIDEKPRTDKWLWLKVAMLILAVSLLILGVWQLLR
ncbi:MAG: polysaccharide biosynthesis tyrosine autokinase [Syntrophobacterales bacterium]|nr:polysaccharide biosynthesis tyrosine autokinase [Syntrophobacterales bacterium]